MSFACEQKSELPIFELFEWVKKLSIISLENAAW